MLPVAKILKSYGTAGDVLIGLFGLDATEIDTKEPVFISIDGLPVPFFIESLTPKGKTRAIIHLTDVDTLRDAEELAGLEICIDAPDEEEEFEDFTGWTLYDGDRLVGTVSGFVDIPGNPCLEVAGNLIPLHEELITEADPGRLILVMNLPEGLLQ